MHDFRNYIFAARIASDSGPTCNINCVTVRNLLATQCPDVFNKVCVLCNVGHLRKFQNQQFHHQ